MSDSPAPTRPLVSIIQSPRERFSVALQSLESVLAHSEVPFELIYVDAGSPRPVARALAKLAAEHDFELIRIDHHLPTNAARNLGIARARGEFVAFVENDVIVSPGWLSRLVDCAEQSGATVVSPLICGGTPLHEEIHCAGGHCRIDEVEREGRRERVLDEQIARQGQRVTEVAAELERGPTGLAEFHCVLVRRSWFDEHGPLDEEVKNTREHVDFCLGVKASGGSIWFEPASLVTYRFDVPLQLSDLPYFMLRWSDRWERESIEYLRRKHDLEGDPRLRQRMERIGWRRREYLVRPMARSLTGGLGGRLGRGLESLASAVLKRLDGVLNRLLHSWNDRRAARAGRA